MSRSDKIYKENTFTLHNFWWSDVAEPEKVILVKDSIKCEIIGGKKQFHCLGELLNIGWQHELVN